MYLLLLITNKEQGQNMLIDDLMAVAHTDICHRFSHYILFLIHRNMIL